jgi:surface protein
MTTVKEDVEYSKSKSGVNMAGAAYRVFAADKTLKYCPKLDISKTTALHGVFAQCTNILTIPIIDASNIVRFQDCFSGCESLLYAPVVNITSKTNTLSSMFGSCKSITSYDFSTWDTSGVTSLHMFLYNNSSIENIDVSGLNTSSVTSMNATFCNCISLKSLDISSWDISNVTNMNGLCSGCTKLVSLKISNFGVNKDVTIIDLIVRANNLGSTEEGMESLRYTFITNSFDRAAAGYSSLNLQFGSSVKARFTDEEKAAITAKGFTIA